MVEKLSINDSTTGIFVKPPFFRQNSSDLTIKLYSVKFDSNFPHNYQSIELLHFWTVKILKQGVSAALGRSP